MSAGRGEGLSVLDEDARCLCHMTRPPPPPPPPPPPCPPLLLSRLSLSYPRPPPLLTPFPPSPRRQGWIPAFISTIQPRCLLATEHGSFNCPPPPHPPPASSCFIHAATYSVPTAFIHMFFLLVFSPPELLNLKPLSLVCFLCAVVLVSLAWSTQTVSVPHLRRDRQAGEAVLSGRVTAGSSRCTKHTLTHNQWEKTGLGPHRSERPPSQNQLAFKLMKRVMKRALSLQQEKARQTGGELIVDLHRGRHTVRDIKDI